MSLVSKKFSHHGYYLLGSRDLAARLVDILADLGLQTHGNADFFEKKYETFTIADARELASLHSTKPVSDDSGKIFVLTIDNITDEAQNALLKLLEEPASYARFFLIIRSAHLLLPTVKSRLQKFDLGKESNLHERGKPEREVEMGKEAEKFLKSASPRRIEMIKELLDLVSKEKKSKREVIDLLDAIEANVYENKGVKDGEMILRKIELVRKYLNDRAPSLKMLLEYVAL